MPLAVHKCLPEGCRAACLDAHNSKSQILDHRCDNLSKVAMVGERDQPDMMRIVIDNCSVYEYLKDFFDNLELEVSSTEVGITRDNWLPGQ